MLVEPKVLKGFRDFLPQKEIERRDMEERLEACFRSFGFVPIDTPALEYAEVLLSKGGGETEKQVYRFADNGGRDVALRFDLTVPFARFLAGHRAELDLPFKRYHIAKVWRGENTQRGRYREFTQCDFDIVGSDSPAADYEILLMIKKSLEAVDAGEAEIRLNHRGIFNRFLSRLDVGEKAVEILRTVDKIAKIGMDAAGEMLSQLVSSAKADAILRYIETKPGFEETLAAITEAAGGDNPDSRRLETIRKFMLEGGEADAFVLDPSITRGLDYYTGVVFETFLRAAPEIGSVCSGGRYDNLVSLYSKEKIPGVGSSVGLDRLLAALESLGKTGNRSTYAKAAVACINETDGGIYQALGERLRDAGIPCEVMLEEKKLSQQFILAEKRGIPFMLIPGDGGKFTIRDLSKRQNTEGLTLGEAVTFLKNAL